MKIKLTYNSHSEMTSVKGQSKLPWGEGRYSLSKIYQVDITAWVELYSRDAPPQWQYGQYKCTGIRQGALLWAYLLFVCLIQYNYTQSHNNCLITRVTKLTISWENPHCVFCHYLDMIAVVTLTLWSNKNLNQFKSKRKSATYWQLVCREVT